MSDTAGKVYYDGSDCEGERKGAGEADYDDYGADDADGDDDNDDGDYDDCDHCDNHVGDGLTAIVTVLASSPGGVL